MPFDLPAERSPSSEVSQRKEAHRQVRTWLTTLYQKMVETPPEKWTLTLYRFLGTTSRVSSAEEGEGREAQRQAAQFIRTYAQAIQDLIRIQAQKHADVDQASPEATKQILEATDHIIHEIANILFVPESQERREDEQMQFISIEALRHHAGIRSWHEEGREMLEVRTPAGKSTVIKLPASEQVIHKGGAPRIILKMMAQGRPELLEAEVPPNDIDVIVCGEMERAREEALKLGADLEGIEQVATFNDMQGLFEMRDTDLNQCFLGKKGLYFSARAMHAARTGEIEIAARNRPLYGAETFMYEEQRVLKARALMRLIKFTVEGKAKSFTVTEMNAQISLGIYWLFLARKFFKKQQGAELLHRMIALQTQLQPGVRASDAIGILDAMHEQYPFFQMEEAASLSGEDVMRWLAKKAIKVADKRFRTEARIPATSFLESTPTSQRRINVSLNEYEPDLEEIEQTRAEWPAFLARCRERNRLAALEPMRPLFIEDDDVTHDSLPPAPASPRKRRSLER